MPSRFPPHLFKRHGNHDEEEESSVEIAMPNFGTNSSSLESSSGKAIGNSSTLAEGNVNLAFGLVAIAAFFGFIGSLLGVYIPRIKQAKSNQFLAGSLSLSGGVLIFLSLTDIIGHARAEFRKTDIVEQRHATTITLGLFIGGIILYMGIKSLTKRFAPHHHHENEDVNPMKSAEDGCEYQKSLDSDDALEKRAGLKSSAIEIAITLALHNIPEGIILFTSTLSSSSIGINLAIGLIFHKLPEGLIIAMPFYAATKSVWKSLLLAFVASSFFLFVGAILVCFLNLPYHLVVRCLYKLLEPIR
jgi:ZIP family zinc transporter